MKPAGQHLLVEYHGCDSALLDDASAMEEILGQAATAAGATVVAALVHRFVPSGVTGVVVLEESHLSIHTWPDHRYAAVDFYTCGQCEPERAHEHLHAALGAARAEVLLVHRGGEPPGPSLRVASRDILNKSS